MFSFLPVLVTAAVPAPTAEHAIRKATPVLVVERIEPSLSLWVERLGFEKTAEVPEGGRLGFVILARGGIEIMYQTRESVATEIETADLPRALLPPQGSQTTLFLEIDNLDDVRKKLEGFDVLLPYRKTAYGAEELWLKEPGGHIIGFAQFPEPEP
jgi:hypothetical protein